MKIVFVRHAQPDYKLDCLTPVGHLQAQAAAERLADEPITAIYSSSCGRAVQTAEYIAGQKGLSIREQLDFMREIRWGRTDGAPIAHNGHPWTTVEEMVQEGQSLLDFNWQEQEPFSQNTRVLELVEPIASGFDRLLSEYGVEREGSYYRLRRRSEDAIVVVSHGGSSQMVLAHLFNLPAPFVFSSIGVDFTGITVVNFPGKEGDLVSPCFDLVNDARHINGIDTRRFFGN